MSAPIWYHIQFQNGESAFNMAFDETLLDSMAELRKPVLRFYGWTEPAASFGYFQKYGDVAAATELRPLVRRPTAGGLVPHDCDWTYCLVFPSGHEWYSLSALDSYRRVHEWIQAAFHEMGIKTELAAASRRMAPGQCFAGHERFDVLWNSRKIAGAAQRRTRNGLLIQGSVQPPSAKLARADWEAAMRRSAEQRFQIQWEPLEPDPAVLSKTTKLAAQKYSRDEYNRKR